MILSEVKVKPAVMPEYETLQVENPDGLKWAVVFNDKVILAVFGAKYWAEYFVEKANVSFTIREIAEG